MDIHYTAEKNSLILLTLLKAHGVNKIVVSPGATNLRLVASLQQDKYFTLYSSVDERSAAYMACGLAAESGKPVMLSCTGATSSRNYMPALTEAYYRKLPILVVTSSQYSEWIGNLKDQVTNRIQIPADIVRHSVQIDEINCERQEWNAINKINEAILELKRRGGGPSHINLITSYSPDFSITKLPDVRVIHRYAYDDVLPALPHGPIGILIGSHRTYTSEEESQIETFCEKHNAIVFCDHTSGYYGKRKMNYSLVQLQQGKAKHFLRLLIHVGEVSGDMFNISSCAQEVWRINEDGDIKDPFKKLTDIFEMKEITFFKHYVQQRCVCATDEYPSYVNEYEEVLCQIPDLPFSNIWMAQVTASCLPEKSVLHLGILTSLRSWNFFRLPDGVSSFSNVGGFGIDGNMSTLLGASLVHPERLYFGVVGDLSFFYDMNVLGNRHVGRNLRILLVNNGKGCEFTHHMNMGSILGEKAYPYICAEGHFGHKSSTLVRHYAEDLGFLYLTASSKDEYLKVLPQFLDGSSDSPILLEAFTRDIDENEALKRISQIKKTKSEEFKASVKKMVGKDVYGIFRKVIKKIVKKNNMHSQLKICLVTWYGSNNYGTNLQAYALYTFLKGMGHRVDLIRPFRGRRMFHQYPGMPNESVRSLKGVLKSILGMRTPENIRQGKIMKFLKKEFSFAPLVRDENGIAEINAGYDCFVTGSDQIWNPYNLDTFYLLDFVKEDAKKIAYSSSVAVNTIPEDLIPTYRHYLSQFKALSCRERTGAELLSRLLNRPVKTVLDPVLLLDGQTWVEFSQKSIYNRIKSVTEPFIFCYFIGDKDFEWKALSEIKHKIGISKVIVFSVSPSRYNNTEYEYMRAADIYDFVWFLHHACYVVTDSFHNIALSIRLKKEFVALMRCDNDVKSENSRVSDFLETFDIGFKTYMPASDNYLAPIPYDSVSFLLDKKIRECKNYLEDALI